MAVLAKDEIIKRLTPPKINDGAKIIDDPKFIPLIENARKSKGVFDVEAASYDLMAGIAVSKRHGRRIYEKRVSQIIFDPNKPEGRQETATLKPGQMMFVITHEEIHMPPDLSGTVYSRNSLAQKGILALNAGHIDPGFNGPITIKLINLRSTDYTLRLGEPIFTIVFHSLLGNPDSANTTRTITKEETIRRVLGATDVSLNNALYDLALLSEFVKEEEFGRALRKWIFRSFWGILTFIVTSVLFLLGAAVTVYKFKETFFATPNQ